MNIDDRFEVTDLIYRSLYALDLNDMEEFREYHSEEHVMEFINAGSPSTFIEGRENYVSMMANTRKKSTQSGRYYKHHISNVVVDEISEGRLWGRGLGIVTVQKEQYAKPEYSHTSTVEYEFRLSDNNWRISKTKLTIDNIRN